MHPTCILVISYLHGIFSFQCWRPEVSRTMRIRRTRSPTSNRPSGSFIRNYFMHSITALLHPLRALRYVNICTYVHTFRLRRTHQSVRLVRCPVSSGQSVVIRAGDRFADFCRGCARLLLALSFYWRLFAVIAATLVRFANQRWKQRNVKPRTNVHSHGQHRWYLAFPTERESLPSGLFLLLLRHFSSQRCFNDRPNLTSHDDSFVHLSTFY